MRTLAEQLRDRHTTNARHVQAQHLTEQASIWRECQRGQDDALAPVERKQEEIRCVPCVVTTLTEPVEVVIGERVRGTTDLCIYLPRDTEVLETDELRVGAAVYDVLGPMRDDTNKTLLPVYVVRRN